MRSSSPLRMLTLALLVLVQTAVTGYAAPCALDAEQVRAAEVGESPHAHHPAPSDDASHHAPAGHAAGCDMAAACVMAADLAARDHVAPSARVAMAPLLRAAGDYESVKPAVEPPPPR